MTHAQSDVAGSRSSGFFSWLRKFNRMESRRSGDHEGPRYLSIPRFSISAAVPVHRGSSGRDGQRLAGVGGVVDFIGSLIPVQLMNPSPAAASWREAGYGQVEVRRSEIPTPKRTFRDTHPRV